MVIVQFLALGIALPGVLSQAFLPSFEYEEAVSIEFPDSLSAACAAPLQMTLQCNSTLASVAMGGYFPSEEDLSYTCTSHCLSSLRDLRNQQKEWCSPGDIITTGGLDFPLTLTLDQLIFTYNYICIKDDLLSYTSQAQLSSYFGYDDELAEEFSFLRSSCSKTNYPVTSPPVYTVIPPGTATISVTSIVSSVSASATATTHCAEEYIIQKDDTCYSISTKFNSSTHELLYSNNLPAYCVGFPSAGTTLCIPDACDIYTVRENNTCYNIMYIHAYAFTITQLISWNPNISRGCANLDQLVVSQICISFEEVDAPTVSSVEVATAPVPTNLANGTNTRCAEYHQASTNEICSIITTKMGISLTDFYFHNPRDNSTSCDNLTPGESYCVKAVGDVNTYPGYGGISQAKCIFNGTIASSCLATITLPTDTYWEFPSAMDAISTSTSVRTYTTLPVASGTVSNCAQYAQYAQYCDPGANRPNTVNTYDYIAYFYGIIVDELVQLNPSLSYNKSNPSACSLQKGYRYCMRSLNGTTSVSTSQLTTANGEKIPTSTGTTTSRPT